MNNAHIKYSCYMKQNRLSLIISKIYLLRCLCNVLR
jgi:hypothetical protein